TKTPDANTLGASRGPKSVTLNKADQAITVTTNAPDSAVYKTSFTVAATGGGSIKPVTISATGACSGTGTNGTATITMTSGNGTCTVTYNQDGTKNYNAAPQVTETAIAIGLNQTITFAQPASPQSYGATFNV